MTNNYRVILTHVIEYEAIIAADDPGEAARQLRMRAVEVGPHADDSIAYVKRDLGVTDVHVHKISVEGGEKK